MINKTNTKELKTQIIYNLVVKNKCDYDEVVDYIESLSAEDIINISNSEPLSLEEKTQYNINKVVNGAVKRIRSINLSPSHSHSKKREITKNKFNGGLKNGN